jgi:hypothetical protein
MIDMLPDMILRLQGFFEEPDLVYGLYDEFLEAESMFLLHEDFCPPPLHHPPTAWLRFWLT